MADYVNILWLYCRDKSV